MATLIGSTNEEIFTNIFSNPNALTYSQQLRENTLSSENFDPNQYPNALGSIEGTSCICPIFTVGGRDVIVAHLNHDQNLDPLLSLFNKYKEPETEVVVDFVGGIQNLDPAGNLTHRYELLDRHTQGDFERMIRFCQQLPLKTTIASWTLSPPIQERVISDFIANGGRQITPLQRETLANKCTIPDLYRRKFIHTTLGGMDADGTKRIQCIYDSSVSTETLCFKGTPSGLFIGADYFSLLHKTDAELLKESTTPTLEGPNFSENIRKTCKYASSFQAIGSPSQRKFISPTPSKSTLKTEGPVVILQGECARQEFPPKE